MSHLWVTLVARSASSSPMYFEILPLKRIKKTKIIFVPLEGSMKIIRETYQRRVNVDRCFVDEPNSLVQLIDLMCLEPRNAVFSASYFRNLSFYVKISKNERKYVDIHLTYAFNFLVFLIRNDWIAQFDFCFFRFFRQLLKLFGSILCGLS